MKYRVIIQQDEDGMLVAEVPALPGCISQGATRIEVLANIREAIEAYLESLKDHGEPIPLPSTKRSLRWLLDLANFKRTYHERKH
ncbi:MAG: type II toxin-antitoxin system HicB family antitoxin [Candidatus Nitrotoga sp.]